MPAQTSDLLVIEREGVLYKLTLAEVEALLASLGYKRITVGTTAPSAPAVGDLWVDTN